ncbi:uncharacterized mitochondrial protein AtMg00810-like [Lactuca sativa]|uniref:uncharacterized mitochondrial protein AtMg00810-like n=1 Tax=Lactuca sativa TaxID=4236 RepID=UPI000CD7FB52|nr:uncharacterized mitochondrial protein AtMg00810-like [Lactuca sativa]
MEPKLKVKKDEDGEKNDPTEYRKVVGCLRYLTHTRPNLSFSVGTASHFIEEPTTLHFQFVKHILPYMKGTIDYGLNYGRFRAIKVLVGFTDSDLGGDPVDSKSTSGMIFYQGRNVITWKFQKRKVVTLSTSTCEVEFMAATTTACQAIWLANLVKELTGHHITPITLYVNIHIDEKSRVSWSKQTH